MSLNFNGSIFLYEKQIRFWRKEIQFKIWWVFIFVFTAKDPITLCLIYIKYLTKMECMYFSIQFTWFISKTYQLMPVQQNLIFYTSLHLLQHFKSVGDVTGRTKCSKSWFSRIDVQLYVNRWFWQMFPRACSRFFWSSCASKHWCI